MKIIALLRTALFLSAMMTAFTARADTYNVLVMGDSIGAAYGLAEDDGWVSLAETTLLEEGLDVSFTNASITGDTTAGGLRRLPEAIDRFKPDLVVIELGGNDGLRGYQPSTMQQNLQGMADIARNGGADVLIAGMMIPSNYGPAYRKMFSDAFVSAAQNTDSALLPFLLEPIATDRDYFQSDGIHPTADAQPLIMQHVLPLIRQFVSGDD